MPPPPLVPAGVLDDLLRSDPGRPRITCYDDATGERVELSAKTLANWVAKAANLLQEHLDARPGTSVGLDLPAHWRSAYWALAGWSVGATLVLGAGATAGDVVVTTDPASARDAVADGRYAVLVTLAALARAHPDAPPGVVDEARELAGHPDRFVPWERPAAMDPAWRDEVGDTAYARLVDPARHPAGARVRVADRLGPLLRTALDVWAADGSIVLCRNALGDQTERLAAERVTLDRSGDGAH